MVLNGELIKSKNLVKNAVASSFRNSSYDLRIKTMFSAEKPDAERFTLEPQGIVEVVSAERIELPDNIVGYAMVKTGLCNEGIFAINIGIIDPGYSGLVSSTLVNLGKTPYILAAGDVFLRLVFHEFEPQSVTSKFSISDDKYLEDKRQKLKKYFGGTFLDIPSTVQRLTKPVVDEAFGEWKKTLFWWVPLSALSVTLMALLVNWGATWSARNVLLDTGTVRRDVLSEVNGNTNRDQRLLDLEREIRNLTEQMNALQLRVQPPVREKGR
jgi:deoxycytidine triphosphate deaminase